MSSYIQDMFVLQQLVLQKGPATSERQAAIRQLRAKVPDPIRAHCERLLALGRKGVSLVQHGVCSECHIRIPSGTLASMTMDSKQENIYLCESCGCYLRADPAAPVAPTATKRKSSRLQPAGV
ncbi:MAG: hypothetical protein ABSE59_05050 [Opitutaceae bacterium]|jgi:predicted  nucleic acid-binding Zn-ribbon protein